MSAEMEHLEIPLGKRSWKYRFFEMVPGVVSWTVIALPLILSFLNPTLAAWFIIMFMAWWLMKAISLTFRVLQGYRKLQRYLSVDWKKKLEEMNNLDDSLHYYKDRKNLSQMDEWHYEKLLQVATYADAPKVDDLMHAVIIAVYNESEEVVEPTLQSVLDSQYDCKKMILVFAYEERGGAEVEKVIHNLVRQYGDQFYHALAVKHPHGIPGEVIGKGPNITFAGYKLKTYLEKESIEPRNVIVTTLDADNRPHPSYFAH